MQMIGRHFDRDCCYGPVSARRAELSHVVEFQPIRHFSPVNKSDASTLSACAVTQKLSPFTFETVEPRASDLVGSFDSK